ncbi:MAG: ATP-binding protein [bacterium]
MKKVLIIGGGRRGKGLLEILHRDPNVEITGVVDKKDDALGIKSAKELNIPTHTDYKALFTKPIDIVLDVSGDPSVFEEVFKLKREETEVLGGFVARLISDVLLERHDAHSLISAQKKEIESMLHGMGEAVLIIDKEKKIFLVNPVAQRLLGVKKDDMLIQKEHGSIIGVIERASEKDMPIMEEIEFIKKIDIGSTSKMFNIVASRIDDEEGNFFAVAAIIRDITEEKKIETLKNELIANVSHELRTPLTSITNSIYLLEASLLSEKQARFTDIIKKNTERLLRVINNLLDISRIESGMLSLRMDVVSIPNLIEDSITSIKGVLLSKKIELKIDIEDGFPEIYGDKEGITHILTNLLSNACKFTPPEGKITISGKAKEEDVYISVADTGVGIPSDELDRIFGKFQRATTAEQVEGTGLGLTIVKHFVNMHKGRISVESEIGRGTKFIVTLPKIDKYFHLSLEEEIFRAKREEAYFSIILIKLENYLKIKSENEKWRLLSNIEERIKAEIHRSDRVIRYKDRGFFVILLHAGKEEAEKVGDRLREFVDGDLFKDVPQTIYVSYGIAVFPEDGEDKESLLKKLEADFIIL